MDARRAALSQPQAQPPCCEAAVPEAHPTRCFGYGYKNQCRPVHAKYCPVGCGHCRVFPDCPSHPAFATYERVRGLYLQREQDYQERVKAAADPKAREALAAQRAAEQEKHREIRMMRSDRVNDFPTPVAPSRPPAPNCGALTSAIVPTAAEPLPFRSLRDAARVPGLVGKGMAVTSCIGLGWDYLVTRCQCARNQEHERACALCSPSIHHLPTTYPARTYPARALFGRPRGDLPEERAARPAP